MKENILLIGSGGRENALAWKLAQSPLLNHLYIAPGNPGTASCGQNVTLAVDDRSALLQFCREKQIHLVVVGPEAPLANGLADFLTEAGIRCFGPSQAAAQIEASKAFAKDFMLRWAIPSARYAVFSRLDEALEHLKQVNYPLVIKASGLAAGKGVILPASLPEAEAAVREMLEGHLFGAAGEQVVIEERLTGREVSLMAFTDGTTVKAMLAAQDHKRIFDNDQGPNTGGMGAYAPVPFFTPELKRLALESVLQPAVNGLKAEGHPFVGVLYAGLMLTPEGIRTLEFNCRFGDPETQAVLPLLESDLLEIMLACVEGRLAQTEIAWREASSVCVTLAAPGYPDKAVTGAAIRLDEMPANAVCFQAGTRINAQGQLVATGGRVLNICAQAETLPQAIDAVYAALPRARFEGMQYRKDIGSNSFAAVRASIQRAERDAQADIRSPLQQSVDKAAPQSAYAASGVSIDAGNRAVALMKSAVQATYTPAVLAGVGSFGGLLDAAALKDMQHPVLVASTDGVGTKVKLAAQFGRFHGIGQDIVNHCIDDILVQGARPLFFMDYFAASKLIPEQTAEIVTGMAEACRAAGVVLLGGETAEMPGVYLPGEFDVAGTIVGLLERHQILPRSADFQPGDKLIGLASSGPHTNGYSLIRSVFGIDDYNALHPGMDLPLIDALLQPHRSYLPLLKDALQIPGLVKGLAHLTGGGFIENIPRVLPAALDAKIYTGSWPASPLWSLIEQKGAISHAEMYRVFNMGIGMVVIAAPEAVSQLQSLIPEPTWVIGELVSGSQKTILS